MKAGTALPSESDALKAELLRRRQAVAEQTAARKAAIAVLGDLIRKPIDPSLPLAAPDLTATVVGARNNANPRDRPEFQQFQATRDVLDKTGDALSSQLKPRLSAFGQAGYGSMVTDCGLYVEAG